MRKGFTRKPKADEPATQGKNYITPSGLQRLHDEHRFLLSRERPAVTEVVAWAASNGDRSENADVRQAAAAPDRWADSLSQEANRSCGSGGPGNSENGASGHESILRRDRALCQCRGSGASGEHRGHRRSRSRPQPHQLGVASGARVAEVGSGRQRRTPSAGRYRIPGRAGSVLRAHFC